MMKKEIGDAHNGDIPEDLEHTTAAPPSSPVSSVGNPVFNSPFGKEFNSHLSQAAGIPGTPVPGNVKNSKGSETVIVRKIQEPQDSPGFGFKK